MNQPCTSCGNEVTEFNRGMDSIRINAQKQADEEKRTKAICQDEATGLFIADIGHAIRNGFRIIDTVSAIR